MKRIFSALLCCVLVLSLVGCGASDSAADSTVPAETAATTVTEPPRVFLDSAYTVNNDFMESDEVQVHSVTAEVLDDTILYDIEYTAPEGMYLQVAGTELNACWDYMTPGGKDRFTFEADKAYVQDHLGNLIVVFKYTFWKYAQLNITSQLPDEAAGDMVQLSVTQPQDTVCRINLATVRAVSEDLLHFHIEYNTPLDQRHFAGLSFTENPEDIFFSVGVAAGDDSVSLMVPRAEAESTNALYVSLFNEEQVDNPPIFTLSVDTLPEFTAAIRQEDTIDNADNTALPVEVESGKQLQLDSVQIQTMDSGNLYTLKGDFSGTRTNTVYCGYGNIAYTVTTRVDNPNQLQFFVPAEYLSRATSLGVECWGPEGYVGWIPLPFDFAPVSASVIYPQKATAPIAVEPAEGQIVQQPNWSLDNGLDYTGFEIFNITETLLENGNTRYVVDYQSPAGMTFHAFIPPNGEPFHTSRLQETSGRREFFAFEIESSIMDQIQYITLNCENFNRPCFIYLEKNWYNAQVTDGNPVGEAQDVTVRRDSNKVQIHSMTAQELDNGFIRYTMEYTTDAGRRVSFFNQPNNDHFIYLTETLATGGQDTYVVDVPKADNNDVNEITMKFYDISIGDHVYARFKPPVFE